MASGPHASPPVDAVRVDGMVLAILGGLAIAAFALLPAGLAGQVAAGVAVVAALGLGVALAVRVLPLGRERPVSDLALAGLGVAVIALVMVSETALPDGKAILLVGGITAIGSWLAYRRRLDDRRRAVAVALEAEIEIKSKFVRRQLTSATFATMIRRTQEEDFKPFTFEMDRFLPAYHGNQPDLGLLPPETVMLVVEFYDLEDALTRLYNGIGTAAFHGLPKERRIGLYREFERQVTEDYLPVADRVLSALRAVHTS